MTKTMHDDIERNLRDLFNRQHHAITPSHHTWDETASIALVDLDSRHVGPRRRIGVALIAFAAVAAMVTIVISVSGRDPAVKTQPQHGGSVPGNAVAGACTDGTTPATYACSGSVGWDSPQVHLDGGAFSIITVSNSGAQEFTANDPNLSVHSDPGSATYQTLELEWHEHGVEQRWYIYFASDGQDWWASAMRTYDGQSPTSDWVTFNHPSFRTPLGSAWSGTLDVSASDHGVTSHLRMQIAHLQAFLSHGPDPSNVSGPTTLGSGSSGPQNVVVTTTDPNAGTT